MLFNTLLLPASSKEPSPMQSTTIAIKQLIRRAFLQAHAYKSGDHSKTSNLHFTSKKPCWSPRAVVMLCININTSNTADNITDEQPCPSQFPTSLLC